MHDSDAVEDGPGGLPDEIFAWIEGNTTPEVRAVVNEWLAADPSNEARLAELRRIWQQSQLPAGRDGWSALEARIDELERKRAPGVLSLAQPARAPWQPWLRAAAILVIGLGIGLAWQSLREQFAAKQYAHIVVPAGSQSMLVLPGGVQVRLNYASELSYAPSANVREVELKGEAYIAVPHGARDNFIVKTEAGTVRDLGTEFNVRARQGMTSVMVTKGRVELGTAEGEVTLAAGQESSVAVGGAPTLPAPIDVEAALGWMEKRLTFFDQPLSQVALELEYRYGAKFEVADDEIRATRITAKISPDASAADAAQVICLVVQARCTKVDEHWVISK